MLNVFVGCAEYWFGYCTSWAAGHIPSQADGS